MSRLSSTTALVKGLKFVAIAGVVAGLATACGSSKQAQCNNLIEEINAAGSIASTFEEEVNQELAGEMQRLGESGSSGEPDFAMMATDVNSAADKLDQKVGELVGSMTEGVSAVELEDETLIEYQNRHVALAEDLQTQTSNMTNSLREMSTVLVSMDEVMQDAPNFSPEQMNQLQTQATELQTIATDIEASGSDFAAIDTNETELLNEINTYCGADA